MESCYLLLNGELPTDEQKKQFNYDITRHTMVPEQLIQFYKVSEPSASTNAVLVVHLQYSSHQHRHPGSS